MSHLTWWHCGPSAWPCSLFRTDRLKAVNWTLIYSKGFSTIMNQFAPLASIHIRIFLYMYMHIYTYVYAQVHTHIYVCLCMPVRVCVCVPLCLCVSKRVCDMAWFSKCHLRGCIYDCYRRSGGEDAYMKEACFPASTAVEFSRWKDMSLRNCFLSFDHFFFMRLDSTDGVGLATWSIYDFAEISFFIWILYDIIRLQTTDSLRKLLFFAKLTHFIDLFGSIAGECLAARGS